MVSRLPSRFERFQDSCSQVRSTDSRGAVLCGSGSLQALGGGLLMGVGAAIAGGCNIGHGLTGVPLFGLSSVTATLSIMLGVWTGVYFLFGSVAFERRVQ